MSANIPRQVFIAAISSDIGSALARRYLGEGCEVTGTYRDDAGILDLAIDPRVKLIRCDLSLPGALSNLSVQMTRRGVAWDIFISAIGQLSPIGAFLDADRDAWIESVSANGAMQLGLLHAISPFRIPGRMAKVAFLVGGAISRSFPSYSAYSLGKLQLVKFCELIHDECDDMQAVAIGTGWVATKIHEQTLAAGDAAGDNFERTREFVARKETGTSIDDIKACLDWCFAQPRDVTGGRNFSVVYDDWRNGGQALARALAQDTEAFKLRRHGNNTLGRVTS